MTLIMASNTPGETLGDGQFPMTRWTLVLEARDGSETESFRALSDLCTAYWYPIYGFLRRSGAPPEDAADSTQDFFAALVKKGFLSKADPAKGKLRSFLLAALKNYRSMEYRAKTARKRGGGAVHVPIDLDWAEGRMDQYGHDKELSPEAAYDREWAMLLLERVMGQLRAYFEQQDKAAEFEALQPCLSWNAVNFKYSDLAEKLDTTEGNIKVKVSRMRKRYRDLLLAEVRETLDSEDVEEELRHLLGTL